MAFHQAWLEALTTLDFDRLSRNAQVNYLAIKTMSEMQIARATFVPQTNVPRKADSSGIEGAARIVFSLKFHMGQWSPEECVTFLVNEVGHERENAIAAVRRSFQGNYGPLYQAAYLLGGLQLRGLRRELVDTKLMTNKQFHDAVMLQGSMPIPLIRLALTPQPLTRDMSLDWKFYGAIR